MPRNGGAAEMKMRSRANTSHRTVHHSKQHQKSDSASSSLDEAELALPSNASIADQLEKQFRLDITSYMFDVDIDNQHFERFCKNFAESPIEFAKKIQIINQVIRLDNVIQLAKYTPYRLCALISCLPAACQTLAEFTEFIFPLYKQEISKVEPRLKKNVLDNLINTITSKLLNKLSTVDLYAILALKVNNQSIMQWIYEANEFPDCMKHTMKAIQKNIKHCDQTQLAEATTILATRIRDRSKTKDDQYHDVSIWILSLLFWVLSRTNNPKAIFDLAKEYPIQRESDYILKHIAFCIFALGVKIPRKEVEEEINKLFTIGPKSKDMLFENIDKAARGKALFDLIEAKLLPRDYVISSDDKELVFDHILKKVPAEKRNCLLNDISNHTESRLNKFLWPKPGHFSMFRSPPKLPERWISEINKVIGMEANQGQEQDQTLTHRPGCN